MMRYLGAIIITILATVSAVAQTSQGSIVRLDPALDGIVPSNAQIEKVAGDFAFTESPVWVRRGAYLLLSDIANNRISKWSPAEKKVSTFLDRPDPTIPPGTVSMLGGSNGITIDPQGRLVYCVRGTHQVMRLEADGRRAELASQIEGKRLNCGCNDSVFRSDGSLYFTDPRFGVRERREKGLPDVNWELPYLGVFRLKDGQLQLLTKELSGPNGIAFTPDEKHLYVVDDVKKRIMKFEVKPDGSITNAQVFIDMTPTPGANPDSMKVDGKGNVYVPGPGGLWIISPAGKHLGTFSMPEQPTNAAFGDADGKSLYVTAQTSLYRVRLKVSGPRP